MSGKKQRKETLRLRLLLLFKSQNDLASFDLHSGIQQSEAQPNKLLEFWLFVSIVRPMRFSMLWYRSIPRHVRPCQVVTVMYDEGRLLRCLPNLLCFDHGAVCGPGQQSSGAARQEAYQPSCCCWWTCTEHDLAPWGLVPPATTGEQAERSTDSLLGWRKTDERRPGLLGQCSGLM